ncbi:PfkB family carbohydrate kinase [Balneatrix alpica]|uniref:PfkB family carbohydrate kinase n=1 Tax=Balneatrix alpica TaxID=75684 RepID=A0ABV5ZE92_9GAMM|nr:PfkB family carbohydrate kinase [Balneatrix alpica]
MVKLLDLAQLRAVQQQGKRVVMIYGDFNVLHPGHFRFIRFAAEQGDYLVVGLNDQSSSPGAFLSNEERWQALSCLDLVQEIVLIKDDLEAWLERIRPQVVVKGKEWQNQPNPETELLERLGTKLLFSSGERFVSSLPYMRRAYDPLEWLEAELTLPYLRRHQCSLPSLMEVLQGFQGLKVAVLGDLIVDEYQDCQPVGMSREDPTIVVTPQQLNRYLGGAGIVAAHARGLGAEVDFYSVVGEDPAAAFAREKLAAFGVQPTLLVDPIRPTTVKKRYRALGKTLLRVNDFLEQDLSKELSQTLLERFQEQAKHYDLVIFSDFNYGFLSPSVVQDISMLCSQQGVPYVADSQSSSQVGDLDKFRQVLLATPTEHEARLTTHNAQDGLVRVSAALGDQLEAKHLFVTLGAEGVLIRTKMSSGEWDTDELPALNTNPVDPAGAGDAMLTSASMALVAGADIWQAALIGSLASACQVGRVGNIPLSLEEIERGLTAAFVEG